MAKVYKTPLKMGTPINKDAYLDRLIKNKDYGDYNDEGLYNDDELREMASYVFDDYGFNDATEEQWDDPRYSGYDEFRDHFLDNFGGLLYDRGRRGVKWSYPSGWDKYDLETKNNAIDYYLDGYYSQEKPDRKYAKSIRDEVYKNIDDYYQKKHNRPYTGSKVDAWRERASGLSDNLKAAAPGLANLTDEQIEDLIKIFGFANFKERDY